ncbi:MAG: transglutaminase domain-containing protein [Nitrospirae bacterium]|nr:transglutaminase domain-containing protein [Nitrospirota bacterium]
MSVLLYRQYTGLSIEKTEALGGSIRKTVSWYDIYVGTEKIGFAKTAIEQVGNEIIIKHEREMKVTKNGRDTVLFDDLRCLSDLSFSVKSFEYASHFKDEKGIKLTGEVDAGEVLFFLESAEKRKTYKTPTKGREFYLPITIISALVQKKPVPDSTFTVPVLDFNSLSIKDVKVSLEEIRPITVGIQIRSLYKFRMGNAIWWSNENGTIVKEEEGPGGMTLYSQVEAVAKDPSSRPLFDYTNVPYFKSDRILPNPEVLKTLKVRVEGFPLDPRLYDASLVALKDGTLTVVREKPEEFKKRSYVLPCRESSVGRYLKADEWVLSEDKNVKGNAHNMAALEKKDAFRMARYLNSELYFTVRVMPTFALSNSLDIFQSHMGDYLERTVMFASFARAAGLPARLVGGLVYRNGYFYFHTWPEVWFDKWIPMDPTLAQFPADVTHIPLKEGTLRDIISVVNDLKPVTIEILEAS